MTRFAQNKPDLYRTKRGMQGGQALPASRALINRNNSTFIHCCLSYTHIHTHAHTHTHTHTTVFWRMLRLKAQLDWRKEKRLIRILTVQNVKEVEYYACNNWMNGLYHHKLLILPPCPCIYRGTICNDTVLITFNKITHNMMWDDYNNRCTEIKTLCNSGGLYVYSWINVSAVICFWLIQWLKNQELCLHEPLFSTNYRNNSPVKTKVPHVTPSIESEWFHLAQSEWMFNQIKKGGVNFHSTEIHQGQTTM